jgi:hypothetical protein
MIIVTQDVSSFEEVVAFYAAWKPFMIDPSHPLPGLPPTWKGMPWHIDQHGDSGTCYAVVRD